MPVTTFVSGDWNAICDQCGRKAKASQLTKRWDGLIVHANPDEGCWETRHPQEFVKAVKDNHPLPWIRSEPEDREITGLCTMASRHAYAGMGTAGCLIVGFTRIPYDALLDQYVCSVETRFGGADLYEADCMEVD